MHILHMNRFMLVKMTILGLVMVAAASAFSMNYAIGIQSTAWREVNCISDFYRLWFITRGGTPERGEIWAVRPQILREGVDPVNPTKYVMAVPGDVVSVTVDDVYVNGEALGLPRHIVIDQEGFDAQNYEGTYHLQDGQYFMLGDTQYTFDSRFWGPVDQSDLIGHARGIIR